MGDLHYDEQQMRAVLKLQQLYETLLDYKPPSHLLDNPLDLEKSEKTLGLLNEQGGFWSTITANTTASSLLKQENSVETTDGEIAFQVPKGIWLCGEVGTGKTLIADLFYETMPLDRKQRVHFHEFMQDVYRQIHRFNQVQWSHSNNPALRAESIQGGLDNRHVLQAIARELVSRSWLIIFDEFQVTDIATAAVLKELFAQVFRMGGVVVATSNRSPDDLYKGGYQRIMFADFMDMLRTQCDVHDMRSQTDYRKEMSMEETSKLYFQSSEAAEFQAFITSINPEWELKELTVNQRTITLSRFSNGVALFNFKELCHGNLGPADYLTIARECHTIILEDVPQMGLLMKDQARRLITLIDACYETKVKLVVSADSLPEDLFLIKPLLLNTPTVVAPLPDHYGSAAYDWANISNPVNPVKPSETTTPSEGGQEPEIDIMQREVIGAAISISSRDRAYRGMWGRPMSEAEQLKEMRDMEKLAIFTAEDEVFAFRRASSRLREMGWSSKYRTESGEQRVAKRGLDGVTTDLFTQPPPSVQTAREKIELDQGPSHDDFGDEASYAGYLKQYKRFNQKHEESDLEFAERIKQQATPGNLGKMKPFPDYHFFGMQNGEDSWSVKMFFRQLRRRYEAPPKK
jgi:predicted ATPase